MQSVDLLAARQSETVYSLRQRMLSGSVTLAMAGTFSTTCAMANSGFATHASAPAAVQQASASAFASQAAAAPSVMNFNAAGSAHSMAGTNAASYTQNLSNVWNNGHTAAPHVLNAALAANDIALNNANANFTAGTMFQDIAINIGGKMVNLDAGTRLTGAELVAAQQVLSSGRQTLILNANGVATGGTFDLSTSTLQALDAAVPGSIGSLVISRGVQVVDSLANLNLVGNLVNHGSIVMGAEHGAVGQTVDSIAAVNIYNGYGASIASASLGSLVPTSIALDASQAFYNGGKIVSANDLNISAPNINNSGLLAATTGNVNFSGGAGSSTINFNNTNGTVQALNGSINFNQAGYAGVSNINVIGGDFNSQAVNFNAGKGDVEVNVGNVTGAINGNACNAHVTTASANMNLGNFDVSGDPTYFNTAGNILVTGVVNGNPDLAIVASGNIIGSGGSLDTSATNGNITLIAGANFVTTGGTSTPNTSGGADNTNTITVSNSLNAGKGSKTGGFVDLSGATLTTKNAPITSFTSGNGNVLIVAYKGTGTNSGSIVATGTAKTGGANLLTAGTGTVTIIGGGAQITSQAIVAKNILINAGTPVIDGIGSFDIFKGTIQPGGGTYTVPTLSNTALNLQSLTAAGGNINLATAGKITGTAAAPLIISASSLNANLGGTSTSLFAGSVGAGLLTVNTSNVAKGTLSIVAAGDVDIAGNVTGAGIINVQSPTGKITNSGGVVGGATATFGSAGNIDVKTAVNTLTAVSSTGSVTIDQGLSSGKALNLLASGSVFTQPFKVTSAETLNVNGGITAGDIDLTETGSTNAVGINIKSTLNSFSGNVSLTTKGTDTIIGSKPVVATNVTINAGGNVGTAAAGFQTKATNLVLNGNAVSTLPPLLSVKDLSTGTLTVSGTATAPQNVQLVSSAAQVNVNKLSFAGVSISDTVVGSKILVNGAAGNDIGDGTGVVKITSAGNIDNTAAAQVKGASVTLTSTGGSVGSVSQVLVNTPLLFSTATKGLVNIAGQGGATPMTIGTGSAKTGYTVSGDNLVVGGTISTTTALTGQVFLIGKNSITQGPATAYLSGANVALQITGAGGKIGLGTGAQSIQTKAITSLQVAGSAASSSFITNTGNLTLSQASTGAAGAALNLAVGTGNKIVANSTLNFDKLTLTSPVSVTLGATGAVGSKDLTINAPSQVLTAGGTITLPANSSLTMISPSILTVTGPTTALTVGANSNLSLNGATAITLGAAGGVNDPLANVIGLGTLNNLSIVTKGIFSGAYTALKTDTATATNTLTLQASSLKNTGAAAVAPFTLTSNNVNLGFSGAQTVTLNDALPTDFKIVSQKSGSTVNVNVAGILNVNKLGLGFTGTGANSISLTGRSLNTTSLLPTYFTTDNKFVTISLGSTLGVFTVGATGTQLTNGVAGDLGTPGTTTNINVVAPSGITVVNNNIDANSITLNTANFKLNGSSVLDGQGSGALTIANVANGALTIGGTGGANNLGGVYQGFGSAILQSTNGGVNAGNLFATTNGAGNMLDSKSIGTLFVTAAGNLSLPTKLSTLNVADNGSIYISAAGLTYSAATTNPQPYLTLAANNGSVQLLLTSDIILGNTARGQIDVQVGTNGAYGVQSGGKLTLNEAINTSFVALIGNQVQLNKSITGGSVNLLANATPTSAITQAPGATITGTSNVSIGQGLVALPAAPLVISAPNVALYGGALSINNTFAGDVFLSQVSTYGSLPLYALNYVNQGASGKTLSFGSITVTAGNANVVTNVGSISVIGTGIQTVLGFVPTVNADGSAGAPVQSKGGNITIQNNDLTGNIFLNPGVGVIANGAAGSGLGNVAIVMGPVPTAGLAAGKQASPNPTLNTTLNGGQIYLTTTANPNGSFTAFGFNRLTADGANIIINGAGNNSAIQLLGNVFIKADPPALPAAHAATSSMSSTAATNAATVEAPSLNAVPGPISASAISSTNWSLPALATISEAVRDGVSANLAGLSDSTVLSGSDIVSGLPRVARAARSNATRVLTGGVSTDGVQTMENGATLISPKTNTTVKTGFGSVDVAAGAVAMIMAYDGGMAVYNLHDNKTGAVVVKVDGNAVKLAPGQNIVLTSKSVRSFEEVNPAGRFVAYRRVTSKDWGKGVTGFHSEFSILSMLQNVGAVRELVKSQDAEMRKTIDAMLKTSAILLQLGGDKYEYKVAPDLTAYAGNR